ncbi:PPC domain-containing protein [Akkermansiaceae bacterium]|nr:PPC domain-containing protein [Akkermansiaceae bacterium]
MKSLLSILFLILAINTSSAFDPNLSLVEPRGGQIGTEVTINLYGDRLYEPEEIILYKPGITVKSLEKGTDHKSAKATLVIAKDAALGEHPLRLRCKGGVSYMRTFWVGQFPTVHEKRSEDNKTDLNNEFDSPQDIGMNVTVQGAADREDADYYRIKAKKGERISVEVEGMRLGRVKFDPYVAILDSKRFELSVNDDSPLLKRDCATSIIAPEDGDYTVLIRETSYEGSSDCQYRLHVGNFPRPTAVYPPAGKPGEELDLTFIGDPSGDITSKVKLGNKMEAHHIKSGNLYSPSGNLVHISPLNYINETEPNDSSKTANPVENPPSAPVAFHGIISKVEDKDWFRFHAKKGEKLRIQVLSRTLRSPLDSTIIVRYAKDGKYIGTNDDQSDGIPDSRYDFDVPEDGDYTVNIADKLDRKSPGHVYRIEIDKKQPALSLTLPPQVRADTQLRKMIQVPRGNRLAIVPNISRSNISCDLNFHTPTLPQGVSVQVSPIPKNLSNFPILFEAKADAPIAGGLYSFEIEDPVSKLRGPFEEKISHVYVNNQGDFHATDSERLAVAVIEEAPFHLDLFAPPVPLVRNGTMNLKITARRAEGYNKKITVSIPWKPPGVGAPNEIDIPEGKNEVYLTLNANGDAPIADYKVLVTGRSSTDKGQVYVSSSFADLKISEPYVQLALQMAATEPGKDTAIIAKVDTLEKYDGEAKVTIHALPHGVTATENTIKADTTELTIPLTVTGETRTGKHGNLFCQVIITKDGHPIPHNVGHGGTLRVDPPPPAPKKKPDAPVVAKVDAPKPATPEKPLSRLEQLRQAKGQ